MVGPPGEWVNESGTSIWDEVTTDCGASSLRQHDLSRPNEGPEHELGELGP